MKQNQLHSHIPALLALSFSRNKDWSTKDAKRELLKFFEECD